MATDLLALSANQRLDLSDLQYLSQAQPIGLMADSVGSFTTRASTTAAMYVLHGFGTTPGAGTNSTNPASNQLTVAPGAGILAWRNGGNAPLFGVTTALDGSDQQAQGIDLTNSPSGPYTVFLRLNYTPSSGTDRTFWSAASPGYEYARVEPTRLHATWEIQALATGSNPGSEWLPIASLSWTSPSTQGGSGTLSAFTDIRPLYFEGRSNTSTPFSSPWGGGTDRSAQRGTSGVGDLHTFVDAMRTCLEDIKGPGLSRWYDASIGGMNMGFGPNTPTLGRLALGGSSFFLQGPTSATAGHAYLVSAGAQPSAYTGLDFAPDRTRFLQAGNNLLALSTYGTMGFGNLAETDIFGSPGRSLVEMVTSASGQSALRLGARAYNGQVPVGLSTFLSIVAPDQANNVAQVLFATGGVQGPERLLYAMGKMNDNTFVIYDSVATSPIFGYDNVSRNLQFTGSAFNFYDVFAGRYAITYASTIRTTNFVDTVQVGALSCLGGATVVQGFTVGGPAQFNGNLNVNGTGSFSLISTTSALVLESLSVGQDINAARYKINGNPFAYSTYINVPTGNSAPQGPVSGTLFFRTGNSNNAYNRLYVYAPDFQTGTQDGLPRGWIALQLG
jgi:hypothetical protein